MIGNLVEALVERDSLVLEAGGRGRLFRFELLDKLARFRFGGLRAGHALLELANLGLCIGKSSLRLGQSFLEHQSID